MRSSLPLLVPAVLALALASACRPPATGPAPAAANPTAAPPHDEDHALPEVAIEAVVLAPQALGLPAMTRVSRGKVTLDQARRLLGRRPSATDVQVFATLAWSAADALTARPDAATALREEARTALRGARAQAGAKVDAVTLQMLATAELWLGDQAAAAAVYEELIARFPEHGGAPAFQTWLAHIYLGQHRVADAARLTASWQPAAASDMQAYVMAWVAFAARDHAVARAAIGAAATRWRDPASRPAVERDLVVMLARGGAEVAQASELVATVATDLRGRYALMFALSEAYKQAGDYARAAAVLDTIIDQVIPGKVPSDELVGFRFRQADYLFRLDQPVAAADRAIQAHAALAACGAKCAGETAEAVIARLPKLAQFSHGVFATSHDPAHLEAATRLYPAYLAIPGRPDADKVRGYQKSLEETRRAIVAGQGRHGDRLMQDLTTVRLEVLRSCYEAVLIGEPTVEGAITLRLEIGDDGAVRGAATEPGPGQAGLAAVATCLVARVRQWHFPSRSGPGITRVTLPIQFRLKP